MTGISIKVLDPNIKEVYDMPCCVGEIIINTFKETFDMPLEYWSITDYQRQWQEGLERLKRHPKSCLITEIQDPNKAPWVNWWLLYKKDEKLIIRNQLLFGKNFTNTFKGQPFTIENCYNFIPTWRAKKDISQWVIDVKDL